MKAKDIGLFIGWLRMWVAFYILGEFRNWTWGEIEFFEKSFEPQNERDRKLSKKVIDFNKKRMKDLSNRNTKL